MLSCSSRLEYTEVIILLIRTGKSRVATKDQINFGANLRAIIFISLDRGVISLQGSDARYYIKGRAVSQNYA
jgi:hypothetical protein